MHIHHHSTAEDLLGSHGAGSSGLGFGVADVHLAGPNGAAVDAVATVVSVGRLWLPAGAGRLLLPAVLVGFLLVTAVVLAVTRDGQASLRRGYVLGVVVVLLAASVLGVSPYPFVDLHLYSPAAPAALGVYELRVVDVDGTELRYDTRAIPPYTNARLNWLGNELVDGDEATRAATATFLLERAERHRERVLTAHQRPWDRLAFPHHVLDYRWTPDRLAHTGRFVAVRVYAVEVYFADDGRSVADRVERLVGEYRPGPDAASILATPGDSPSVTVPSPAVTPDGVHGPVREPGPAAAGSDGVGPAVATVGRVAGGQP
jgi:hypothetical protein